MEYWSQRARPCRIVSNFQIVEDTSVPCVTLELSVFASCQVSGVNFGNKIRVPLNACQPHGNQDMKNSADQGGCCPDNTLWDLQNFSYPMKHGYFQNTFKLLKEKMNSLLSCSPKTTLPLPQVFLIKGSLICNGQRAALLTSLAQYDKIVSKFGQQQPVVVNYALVLTNQKQGNILNE